MEINQVSLLKAKVVELENTIRLLERSGLLLEILEANGVDNWCGYGDSYREYQEALDAEGDS